MFPFAELTRQSGLSGMLWGHPGLIAGLLLANGWTRQGAKMVPGSMMTVGEMPYVYNDPDGDQIALPCTERIYFEREAMAMAAYRVMPLLSLRGRPELRLGGFTSLAGAVLAGPWAPVDLKPAPVALRQPGALQARLADQASQRAGSRVVDAENQSYLRIDFYEPQISGLQWSDDDVMAENCSFRATKISVQYWRQLQSGNTVDEVESYLTSLSPVVWKNSKVS